VQKIDLKGKILQGLFSEKFYANLAKRRVHRNSVVITKIIFAVSISLNWAEKR